MENFMIFYIFCPPSFQKKFLFFFFFYLVGRQGEIPWFHHWATQSWLSSHVGSQFSGHVRITCLNEIGGAYFTQSRWETSPTFHFYFFFPSKLSVVLAKNWWGISRGLGAKTGDPNSPGMWWWQVEPRSCYSDSQMRRGHLLHGKWKQIFRIKVPWSIVPQKARTS